MTNEEAVNVIRYNLLDRGGCDSFSKREIDALALAILALESQPCEDCVKREDVKEWDD